MAAQFDFLSLYDLQDSVLMAISSLKTDFYLTGGTCLHRFITSRRYSEDLDLFCPEPNHFREQARKILENVQNLGKELSMMVDTRDFIRMLFSKTLKIDLVNDRVVHHGSYGVSPQGFRIDNIHNILTNKITAIVSRDEPKDVFDLITIADTIAVDWSKAVTEAREKALFEPDFFIYRLETFPLHLLELLHLTDMSFLSEAKTALPEIISQLKSQL